MNKDYIKAPQGAKNSFSKGLITVDLGELHGITSNEIYEYLITKCIDYGFCSLKHRNAPNCIFCVKDHIGTFLDMQNSQRKSSVSSMGDMQGIDKANRAKKEANESRIHIVICSPATNDMVYKHHRTVWLEERPSENKISLFYYLLNREGTLPIGNKSTAKEMKSKAEDQIESAVRKAKEDYNRDRLW